MLPHLALMFWLSFNAGFSGAEDITASSLRQGAWQAYRDGDFRRAETLLRAALSTASGGASGRAAIYLDLGALYLDMEKLPEAEQAFTNALGLYRREDDSFGIAIVSRHLGTLYSSQRRHTEAIRVLKHALGMAKANHNLRTLLSPLLNSLGVAYFRDGKLSKAKAAFNHALAAALAELNSVDAASALNNLGAVAFREKRFALADQFFTSSLMRTESDFGPDHPALISTLNALGTLYAATGRLAEAETTLRRCLAILERQGIPSDPRLARTLKALGGLYLKSGRKEEAEVALSRASSVARTNPRHPDMPEIFDAYADVLISLGRADEAMAARREARQARIAMQSTIHTYAAGQ